MKNNSIEKGISLKFFGQISTEILKEIEQNNFDCIELSFPLNYFKEIDFIHQSEKYKKMIDNYNIKIWSIHLPYGEEVDISSLNRKIRKNAVKFYIELIQSASKIGIKTIVLHPSYEPVLDINREKQIKNCRKSLKILNYIANKLGMKIAVENMPRSILGNTSKELISILKNIKNIGICFDSNHSLKEDNIEFLKNILKNKIPIYTVHLSDYDFMEERHILPGYGINDWKEIINLLKIMNYNGPMMYEINQNPLGKEKVTLKQIRENQEKFISENI